ncbi:MAG: transporter [Bacteroidales bacterium]|nr:transporter [Bacteroidales bacterium]
MIKNLPILIPLFFILSSQVGAQSDTIPTIVADRPTQAESPYLVKKCYFQLETGGIYVNRNEPQDEIEQISLGTTMIRYGVFENLEVRASGSFEIVNIKSETEETDSTISGIGPISAGFKVFVVKEKGIRPQMAIVGNITIRYLGHEHFSPTYSYPIGKLVCSHTLSKRFTLGYNGGFGYNGENPDGYFLYAVFLGFKISHLVWSFIEVYGNFDHGNLPNHLADAGLTFRIRNNLQADISGGMGFDKDVDRYFVSAGLSWRIPN